MYIKDEAKNSIVIKVTDNHLLAGQKQSIITFSNSLSARFQARKVQIEDSHLFNGCRIQKHLNGLVSLNMQEYWDSVSYIKLDANRQKCLDRNANKDKISQLKRSCGELIWLGFAVLPQASVYASLFLQQMPRLEVRDLIHTKKLLRHLKSLKALITYQRSLDLRNITAKTFSDAWFNICKNLSYGQTGLIPALFFNHPSYAFNPIDWPSCKQKQVCH